MGPTRRIISPLRASLFAALLLVSAGSAAAQQAVPEDVERLAAFMAQDVYQELILSQWQRQSMEICGEAAVPGPLRHAGLSLYERVRFQGGKPLSGVWADRYRGRACGRERQFNFLFTVRDGHAVVRHMLPGRTEAPPRLQIDAMKTVLAHLAAKHPDCAPLLPVDTQLEKAPRHVDDAWTEVWVFEACGDLAVARVHFAPDEDGTGFRVE